MAPLDYVRLYQRRADRVAQLLAGLPFLRLVGLNGSLARGEADAQSDIDFLILTAPRRLYTVRMLATLLVQFLGLRRYGRLIAGRICLNRYQTTDHLAIEPRNAYHAEVFSQLIPLVDLAQTYAAYQTANHWMAATGHPVVSPSRRRPSRSLLLSRFTHRWGEWLLGGQLGDWLERGLQTLQRRKIASNPLTARYPDRIRVTDDVLLFHPPAVGEVDADLDHWDGAADEYDRLQGRVGDPFRRLVVDAALFELLGDVRGSRILDAGSGNGYLSNALAERGAAVIGIDGSAVLVARAQQNFPTRDFRRVDLVQGRLPFADRSFDALVCSMVLQTLVEPQSALREFCRLLKVSGRLIVTLPHPSFSYPVGRARRGLVGRLLGRPSHLEVCDYVTPRSVTSPIQGMNQSTTRYHRTLAQYWDWLRVAGFTLDQVREPTPDASLASETANTMLTRRQASFASRSIPLVLALSLRPTPIDKSSRT